MKIYARQIPPEEQESPLFLGDEFWPENVYVFGNSDYKDHAEDIHDLCAALENIVEVFDDMQRGGSWTNDLAYAIRCELPEKFNRELSRKERLELIELANNYCFARSTEENIVLCAVIEHLTGEKYKSGEIHGWGQGDWQDIIYPATWNEKALEVFEMEYFNTGSQWIIHDEDCEPGNPEDISGYSYYCHEWSDDDIKYVH